MKNRFEQEASGVLGLRTWGARIGVGSFLSLEFGSELTKRGDFAEWHLWLYGCMWRVRDGQRVVCESTDERSKMSDGVSTLNGREVAALSFGPTRSWIQLTGDVRLDIKSDTALVMDQWFLFMPGGRVLKVTEGSELVLTVESEDETSTEGRARE